MHLTFKTTIDFLLLVLTIVGQLSILGFPCRYKSLVATKDGEELHGREKLFLIIRYLFGYGYVYKGEKKVISLSVLHWFYTATIIGASASILLRVASRFF